MMISAVTIAAIAMGPMADPGIPHALEIAATSSTGARAAVPAKRHSTECWRKKHNKHPCIPLIGGGYVSSPPGQPITPIGGGYVSTAPGVAMPPLGDGYVTSPPGVSMPPVVGGNVVTPPGVSMPPTG